MEGDGADSPLAQPRDELVRRVLAVADAGPQLDRQRDLAEHPRHADEALAELAGVLEQGGAGALVDDQVNRAAACPRGKISAPRCESPG